MRFILVLIVAICVSVSARHVRYVPVAYDVPVRVIYDDVSSPRIIIPSRRHLERNINPEPIAVDTLKNDKPQIEKESNIVEVYAKPDSAPTVANNDRAQLLNEQNLSSPMPNKPQDFESNEIIANKEELENLRRVVGPSEDHIAQAPSVEKQLLSGEVSTTSRPPGPFVAVQEAFNSLVNRFSGNRNATTSNSTAPPLQFPNPITSIQNTFSNIVNRFTNNTAGPNTTAAQGGANPIAQIPQAFTNFTQSIVNRFTGGNRNASTPQENNATPIPSSGVTLIPSGISNAAQSIYDSVTGNRTQETTTNTDSTANRPIGQQIGQFFTDAVNNLRPSTIIQRINSTFVNPAQAVQTRADGIVKNIDQPESLAAMPAEIKPSEPLPQKLESDKPSIEDKPEPLAEKPAEEVVKPEISEAQFSDALIAFQANSYRQIERFREAMNGFMNKLKGPDENNSGEDDFLGVELIQKAMNRILDNMESNLNRTVANYLQEASENRMSILERIRTEFQEDLNNISLQFHKWFTNRSNLQSKENSPPPSAFQDMIKRFILQLNRVFGQFEASYNPSSPGAANIANDESGSSSSSSSESSFYQYVQYIQELWYGSSESSSESNNVAPSSDSATNSRNETVLVV